MVPYSNSTIKLYVSNDFKLPIVDSLGVGRSYKSEIELTDIDDNIIGVLAIVKYHENRAVFNYKTTNSAVVEYQPKNQKNLRVKFSFCFETSSSKKLVVVEYYLVTRDYRLAYDFTTLRPIVTTSKSFYIKSTIIPQRKYLFGCDPTIKTNAIIEELTGSPNPPLVPFDFKVCRTAEEVLELLQ